MNNKNDNFIVNYIKEFNKINLETLNQIKTLNRIIDVLKKYKKKGAVHIFGNGGSASIASHFSLDLSNNTDIKCINYNDPSLITCFANDYKYENWISKVIDKYIEKKDCIILVSSSGKSKNMINAIKKAKNKGVKNIITFTGFNKNNPLKKIGKINLWVNSKKYNFVENIHQFYLLLLVDILKKLFK
tara:strand:- start:147 stop:707 length:561 start_codon:yes stop_codon:yes gene_type:complete